MKKLLLISTILSYQLFALECTQTQYSPYFTDKKEERYLFASETELGDRYVVDKQSIKYDKKDIIKAWVIFKTKSDPQVAYVKVLYEFSIKDVSLRMLQATAYNCNGVVLSSGKIDNPVWDLILPGSVLENTLERIKKQLKVK